MCLNKKSLSSNILYCVFIFCVNKHGEMIGPLQRKNLIWGLANLQNSSENLFTCVANENIAGLGFE